MTTPTPNQYIALVGKTAASENQLVSVDTLGQLVISPLKYELSDIDTSNSTIGYYGYVNNTGKWIIKRVTNTEIRFAKGENGYETVDGWSNRQSLSYVRFNGLQLT
jgi:hypothetical protein